MYHHGDIPPGMIIDHINRDRTDDRIENLRLTTRRGNQHNLSNQSKYGVGVTRGRTGAGNLRNKFSATIFKGGRNVWIGSFGTPEEAREAYKRELEKIRC
jgi:Drexlerviridae HNH endonuclease